MTCVARDVLAYIDWVESLLIREAWRCDPEVAWQADLSWAEWAAMAGFGLESFELAPGEYVANVDLATELYWPGSPPDPSRAPRELDGRRPIQVGLELLGARGTVGGVLSLTLPKDRLAVVLEMKVAELHENGVTCRLEGGIGALHWSAAVSISDLGHVPYVGESVQVRVLHV